MKKFLKGLLTITMVFVFAVALTGCGKDESNNGGTTGGNNNEQKQQDETTPTAAKKWGEHDLTAYIPEPPTGTLGDAITTVGKFTASYYMSWTSEQAKAYIKECKNAGYNTDIRETENYGTIDWSAYNSDKTYRVTVSYAKTDGALYIQKTIK